VRVGAVLGRHKVAKHFTVDIADGRCTWARDTASIEAEARLDGLYVIRTSVPAERLDAPATVGAYKMLARVERAFRSLKAVDLQVRPVHHWLAPRVRAHVFLCMLAYYVEFHLRAAWPVFAVHGQTRWFCHSEQWLDEGRFGACAYAGAAAGAGSAMARICLGADIPSLFRISPSSASIFVR
jgi:hypothetical protein